MANPSSLVGTVLSGRYRLTKLIGQGGMGSVYEAHDRQMADRQVAVKVLAPHLTSDETQVTRFEQEARAANQLRHPNTISVLDFGRTDHGLLFMALEYLHGETLTQVMRHGPVDPARSLYMLRQVGKSLAEAHAKGIIHRDLKPDNIFVCEIYGESDFIKVIDFGIAKLAVGGAELTQAGKMFGTPRYLSPEQAQGIPLSAASDLYSLGVILFEMLTGQPPFHADDPMSIAIKHVHEAPPTLHDVAPQLQAPPELEQLVARLLAKRPRLRPQSAEEMLAELDACLVALGGPARGTGPLPPAGPRTPTKPKTIPPIAAPRPVVAPPPRLKEDEATRPVTVDQDATQLFAAAEDEATRALAAVDAEPPAMTVKTPSAPRPTPTPPTPADPRPKGDGRTLALETEPTADGGVRARQPSRAQPQRRRASTAEPAVVPPAHDGPNKWVLLAIAVVLAAVGGGLAWHWRTSAETPPEPASTPPPAESPSVRAPAVEPAIVTAPASPPPAPQAAAEPNYPLEIASDPPGASVSVDGKPVGNAPVSLQLAPHAPPLIAVLSLAGHDDYRLEIDPQQVRTAGITRMPIHLSAKAAPAASKPAAVKAAPRKAKIEW